MKKPAIITGTLCAAATRAAALAALCAAMFATMCATSGCATKELSDVSISQSGTITVGSGDILFSDSGAAYIEPIAVEVTGSNWRVESPFGWISVTPGGSGFSIHVAPFTGSTSGDVRKGVVIVRGENGNDRTIKIEQQRYGVAAEDYPGAYALTANLLPIWYDEPQGPEPDGEAVTLVERPELGDGVMTIEKIFTYDGGLNSDADPGCALGFRYNPDDGYIYFHSTDGENAIGEDYHMVCAWFDPQEDVYRTVVGRGLLDTATGRIHFERTYPDGSGTPHDVLYFAYGWLGMGWDIFSFDALYNLSMVKTE